MQNLRSPDATLAPQHAVAPEARRIPAHSPTETEFSDVLSDYGYDDLIPDFRSDTAQDVAPQTVLDNRDSDKESTPGHSKDKLQDREDNKRDQLLDDDTHSIRSLNSNNPNPAPLMFAPKPTPPHLKLEKVDTSVAPNDIQPDSRAGTPQSGRQSISPKLNKPLPKSPNKSPNQTSPFAALFSWAAPSPSATEFSSIPSPLSPSRSGTANDTPHTTISRSFSETIKPNALSNPLGYIESYLSTPSPTISATAAEIEEMEDELKAISVELASSIRREMDLEDLVDRLQEQINNPQAPGKRSSDYFSDSGYSSAKVSEFDQGRDEVDRIQRKSEQEKASIRLELTTKLQDERLRRKALDNQIKELAEKASQIDVAKMNNLSASDRVKELESTCEDLRRRLSEERTVKNNFEDLVTAMRGELHEACNERDNLRDEVVPQLRARVEGLEAEAAEYANLTYESSKMQQELQSLMKENESLRNTTRSGSATPPINRMSRSMSGSLTRSNSVATGSFRGQRPPAITLSRSNSVKSIVKNPQTESRESLSERLKDVEAQRDALHAALRSLLERQEFQNRENEKKIRLLQQERERLASPSPGKAGFEKEISTLRTELNVLRRRAEDALDEKWEVEKGLGSLKMDLDRAEEEITLLRDLLKEKDILIPPSFARSSGSSMSSGHGDFGASVTSESLQRAYEELQAAYTASLERIKKLEVEVESEETQVAMERLERSLSIAVSERDAAKREVEALRSQFDDLSRNQENGIERERALADELSESARRVEELAIQVQHQLSTNAELRQRLADTVARGERDRKANSTRIAELQVRLRAMEDQLVAAQSASEDLVARHEQEVEALREAHNDHLRRMNHTPGLGGLRSPGFKARKESLLSPVASSVFPRSPRLGPAKSFEEAAQMKVLRDRIHELEIALEDAGHEMQDVVAKMSAAQIEVLNLQEQREIAVHETRRLQKTLEQEQMKSFAERFRTLSEATERVPVPLVHIDRS